ncbi:MAG: TIGR00725 family protein [Bacteroidota bacterium]
MSSKKTIVGVMGPGSEVDEGILRIAFELGSLIASNGWILLTGGRNSGVMEAASKGAKFKGGLTMGILPDRNKFTISKFIDVPVITGMGSARNNINVLTSDIVVVCGMGAGTASEAALAIKAGKTVIFVGQSKTTMDFFNTLGGENVLRAEGPQKVIEEIKKILHI